MNVKSILSALAAAKCQVQDGDKTITATTFRKLAKSPTALGILDRAVRESASTPPAQLHGILTAEDQGALAEAEIDRVKFTENLPLVVTTIRAFLDRDKQTEEVEQVGSSDQDAAGPFETPTKEQTVPTGAGGESAETAGEQSPEVTAAQEVAQAEQTAAANSVRTSEETPHGLFDASGQSTEDSTAAPGSFPAVEHTQPGGDAEDAPKPEERAPSDGPIIPPTGANLPDE